MIRRTLSVLAVGALVVAMMLASALPALAIPPPTTPGQFTCVKFDPDTGLFTEVQRVQRGQVAVYEIAGYSCFRSGQFG